MVADQFVAGVDIGVGQPRVGLGGAGDGEQADLHLEAAKQF